MFNYVDLSIAFFIALVASLLLTIPVKKLAVKIGAVDFPHKRKIHKVVTPRLGGLAIFAGFVLALIYIHPRHEYLPAILLGGIIILITGAIDDKYTITPIAKLTGQLIAASFLVNAGLIIERLTVPFIGTIELGFFSVLITVLWVVGITNAINLIDGLDGLATGVSSIALISIFIMSLMDGQVLVAYLSIALIGANIGFLFHNFYPAKIYMGDSGSNFLGYMISVVSILGLFKEIAFFSFIIPVIVLAVPIFDTLFAIYRRAKNKEKIMQPDNKHIHYRLIEAGFSHRQTVLIIYAFSVLFGGLAILFNYVQETTLIVVVILVYLVLHIFAELAGIVLGGKRPIIDGFLKLIRRKKRCNGSEESG